jgi:hypothetical protein
VPGKSTPVRAVSRYVALMVVLVALGLAAACTSATSGSRAVGPTKAPSTVLEPWHGNVTVNRLPAPVQTLRSVTCPTARRCWAVGSTVAAGSAPAGAALVATIDGGATWNTETVPPSVHYLSGVACPSTRSCIAVGQVGLTGDGPGAALITSNGGETWVLQSVPAGTTDVTAVSCPTGGRCTALGIIAGRVTTLTPSSTGIWRAGAALPPVVSAATALSCTDSRYCWATATQSVDVDHVVGVIAATSDGGTTWALQHIPAGTGALEGIDCNSSTTSGTRTSCTAVGTTSTITGGTRVGLGIVLTTGNGGSSWGSEPVASTIAQLVGVSCAAGHCVAVGSTVASSSQAGVAILAGTGHTSVSAWRRSTVAHVALPLTAVSCASLSGCVIVGESVTAHLAAG